MNTRDGALAFNNVSMQSVVVMADLHEISNYKNVSKQTRKRTRNNMDVILKRQRKPQVIPIQAT